MNVLYDSPLVSRFSAGYSDPEWEAVFGDHRPEQVIRHFHISFDDFGSYDVLAADGAARTFPRSPSEKVSWDPDAPPAKFAADEARKEAHVLRDAMALDGRARTRKAEPDATSWRLLRGSCDGVARSPGTARPRVPSDGGVPWVVR